MKSGQSAPVGKLLARLVATALVLYFIGSLTLQDSRPFPEPSPFFCLLGCNGQEMRDLISNILLFIPLGWVLRYWFSPRVTLVLCAGATIGIEAVQAFALIGRDPSLRDILTNLAGGWIGVWLYQHWPRVIRADRAMSRRIAGVLATTWVLVLTLTAVGVHLSGSRHPWFGMWGNHLENYAPFSGTLQTVTVNDWTPPSGAIPAANPLRDGLRANRVSAEVVAVNGSTVSGPAALIFAVLDDANNEIMFVGGARRWIQLQARTRFDVWGFRGLWMRLPLDSSMPGDTMRIRAEARPDRWEISLRSRSQDKDLSLPLTVGIGWITLLPGPLAIAYEWYLMNTLWLATLSAPIAWYFYRWRRREGILLSLPVLYTPLLLLPLLAGIGWSRGSDWLGVTLGLIFGVLFARRSLHRHPQA